MTGDKCVPVQVALRLMDESSLGLATRYDQFREAHQELQDALKTIVNGGRRSTEQLLQRLTGLKSTIKALVAPLLRSTKFKLAFKHRKVEFEL